MTNMIEVKTAELSGAALDWAVMSCVKGPDAKHEIHDGRLYLLVMKQLFDSSQEMSQPFMPSTRWQEGGPLIQQNLVEFAVEHRTLIFAFVVDENGMPVVREEVYGCFGETYLIAACRAIVLTKLGDTVQVPRELLP